jgi:hypothetical protein
MQKRRFDNALYAMAICEAAISSPHQHFVA